MDQKSIWVNIVMMGISIIYFLFSPTKRNYFYGYRTFKSMKNDADFIKINKKASQMLLLFTSVATAINLILIFIFDKTITEGLMLFALAISIIATQAFIIKKIP